jgi:hypothetical protein
MRSFPLHRRATPTRIVALVAALALAVPLASCSPRANRQDTSSTTGSSGQTTPDQGVGPTTLPPDPAAIDGAFDEVDQALKDVDGALSEADAPNPDAD